MIIGVLGYSEKRHVIYTLMKTLSAYGSTAVITDNGQLRRLNESYESTGYIGDVFVCISDNQANEVFDSLEESEEEFEHIIYDMKDDVPEDADLVIYCDSGNYMDDEDLILDNIDNLKKVVLSVNKIKTNKQDCVLKYNVLPFKYIEYVEANKILDSYPDAILKKYISAWLAEPLKIPAKQIMKVFSRRWKI